MRRTKVRDKERILTAQEMTVSGQATDKAIRGFFYRNCAGEKGVKVSGLCPQDYYVEEKERRKLFRQAKNERQKYSSVKMFININFSVNKKEAATYRK